MAKSFQNFIDQANLTYNKYQEEGVAWCVKKESSDDYCYDNVKGGIVADEMGLGKTITMLGTLYLNPKKCTLIVVPVVLIDQWVSAIESYLHCTPIIYHGQNKSPFIIENHLSNNDNIIVITTYGTLSQRKRVNKIGNNSLLNLKYLTSENYSNSILYNILWDRIIYDEAHNTRNSSTQKFRSCNHINASIKWCVTGTPMQNQLRDFKSLCRLLHIPKSHLKTQMQLEDVIQKFMLRRTKSEIGMQLPPIRSVTEIVDWKSDVEKKLNNKFMNSQMKIRWGNNYNDDSDDIQFDIDYMDCNRNKETNQINQPEIINNEKDNLSSILLNRSLGMPGANRQLLSHYRRHHILDDDIDKCVELLENNLLTSMIRGRQMCIYPALILPKLSEHINNNKISSGINMLKNYSSKLDAVTHHILNHHSTNKKIVFCNFKEEIREIYKRLTCSGNENFTHETIACYDGSLSLHSRQKIVSNTNLNVLIIQIQTACDGLNLQHYNEIYFVSPCWNPSIEDQAIARCHRIGQNKTTFVYRFQMTFDDTRCTNMDDYMELNQRNKRSIIQQLY